MGLLATVHYPLADLRPFVDAKLRIPVPSWPNPISGFIRGFGAIAERKRGGIADFIGEHWHCDASRAILIPRWQFAVGGAEIECRHRRFFSDGRCYSRVEIGFRARTSTNSTRQLAAEILNTRGMVRTNGNLGASRPLSILGTNLATAYTKASEPRGVTSRLVKAGRPIMLIESDDDIKPPSFALQTIGEKARIKDVKLSTWRTDDGVRCWLLTGMNTEARRDTRMCLIGLHTEHECLAATIQAISSHEIAPLTGTSALISLESFLFDSTRRIQRLESNAESHLAMSPLNQARTALPKPELEYSNSVIAEARKALRLVSKKPEPITTHIDTLITITGPIHMGDNLTNSNKTVISNSHINSIKDSFNYASTKTGDSKLKTQLEELRGLVEELAKEAPTEGALAAKHFKKFTEEAVSEQPTRDYLDVSAAGLLAAANAMVPLVEPIGQCIKSIIAIVAP